MIILLFKEIVTISFMKFHLPPQLIWKGYFFLWTWLCLGNLLSLLYPHSDSFIFYHIIKTILPEKNFIYYLALTNAFINLLCLLPLFGYSFNKPLYGKTFWQLCFFFRIIFEILGTRQEQLFLLSFFSTSAQAGLSLLFAILAFTIPSYLGHYRYVFHKKRALI